jgi:ATP phosphoribosyltransferase
VKHRRAKQALSRVGYQWEKGEHKERVKARECHGNIMYSCMKMKPVETILRTGEGELGTSGSRL